MSTNYFEAWVQNVEPRTLEFVGDAIVASGITQGKVNIHLITGKRFDERRFEHPRVLTDGGDPFIELNCALSSHIVTTKTKKFAIHKSSDQLAKSVIKIYVQIGQNAQLSFEIFVAIFNGLSKF